MNINCKVDFSQIKNLARQLPRKLKAELAKAAFKSGEYIQGELVGALESQSLGWAPLSEKYLHWKAIHGFDSRILIRSSLMEQVIRFKRQSFGGWVGIPGSLYWPPDIEFWGGTKWNRNDIKRSRKHTAGLGSSIAEVMGMHEWGGARVRRPLFYPISLRVTPTVKSFYAKALKDALAP